VGFALNNRKKKPRDNRDTKNQIQPNEKNPINYRHAGHCLGFPASAHPHGGCYQLAAQAYWGYTTMAAKVYDDAGLSPPIRSTP